MIYWTVEPSIISGAILEYPDSIKTMVEKYSTILVLSNLPGKHNSIAVKVGKHIVNNSINNPKIQLDKSILGPLVAGDKVIIREFNPPIAKEVLLSINTKYFLADGNWGSTIVNPAVLGQILDIGQNIDFMYGTEKPMFVSGQIKATVPKAPALVNKQTIFIVEKMSKDVLTKLKIESEKHAETRAKEYFDLIEEENFDTLTAIRNNTANKIEKTFNFSQIDPQSIYQSFKQSLERMSNTFILDTFEIVGDNNLASILSIPKTKKGTQPEYSIEFKLSSTLKQGTCLISGYSSKPDLINPLIAELEKNLRKMSTSLKEIPQAIPDICGGCNAKLNLTKQNAKGIVVCEVCKSPNQLPFALRL